MSWDGAVLTASLGVPVVLHGVVGSTMTEAETDPRAPAVHLAERQTAGEGRHGRSWESPAGNLYATIAWPAEEPPHPGLLAAVQIAWAEAITGAGGPRTRCKWPNDGMVAGAKWAGLLARRAGGRILVGLGANLERAPDLADGSATALADYWNLWPGSEAAATLLLAAALDVLRAGPAGVAERLTRWTTHDVFSRGDTVRIETPAGTLTGTYNGVASDGRLRLARDGEETLLAAGDVTRVWAESSGVGPE